MMDAIPGTAGKLFVVATPIGNLSDITYRAVETLNAVDFIAAEDTRTSSILLKHYEISKPMLSFHSYSGQGRTDEIIKRLEDGEEAALITDAGTPGVSDPGFGLVHAAVAAGITVVPIPGPSAFLAALSSSGLRTDRFVFEGFLPVKKGRQTKLRELSVERRTVIFYESPHRIEKTLRDLLSSFGDRYCVIGREITKIHETLYRGSLSEMQAAFKDGEKRGEFVIVVEGSSEEKRDKEKYRETGVAEP
ncbi:MAG: 16S rRNA (cytidine(1402)-2'-O)-methyltransferase [Bacteroidetes bacterium]|nr:16S rRNA (cytidine(1402)-2'-O)-methyltransferase [Bacteroidota bacterium]